MAKANSDLAYIHRVENSINSLLSKSNPFFFILGCQLSGKSVLLRTLYEKCNDNKAIVSGCPRKLKQRLQNKFTEDINHKKVEILFADEWGGPKGLQEIKYFKKYVNKQVICTVHPLAKANLKALNYFFQLKLMGCTLFKIPKLQIEDKIEICGRVFSDESKLNITKFSRVAAAGPNYIGEFLLFCRCLNDIVSQQEGFTENMLHQANEVYSETRKNLLLHKKESLFAWYKIRTNEIDVTRNFDLYHQEQASFAKESFQ